MPIIISTRLKFTMARAAGAVVFGVRRLLGLSPRASVVRRGIRWELDLTEGIDFAIYLTGAFEPVTIASYARLLRPGAVVCDIGANMGAHVLHLAKCVGDSGRVLAFEPTRPTFERLSRNIAANPDLASRITAQQMMLTPTDQTEVRPAIYASWPLRASEAMHDKHYGIAVPTDGARALTLDSALAEQGVARVDLIKLDVDGFEEDVLKGAERTLSGSHPIIVMEVAPYTIEERGLDPDGPTRILLRHGYRFRDLSGKPLGGDGRSLPHIPAGSSLNVIAMAQTADD